MFRNKDFLSGLMFCMFGAGALLISSHYRLGSALRMGPGYFPMLVGGLILLSGIVIAGQAMMAPSSDRQLGQVKVKPVAVILLSVVIFALTLRSLGLVPSLVIMIVLSRLAALSGKVAELPIMVIVLIAVGLAIFIGALDMTLPLWPW